MRRRTRSTPPSGAARSACRWRRCCATRRPRCPPARTGSPPGPAGRRPRRRARRGGDVGRVGRRPFGQALPTARERGDPEERIGPRAWYEEDIFAVLRNRVREISRVDIFVRAASNQNDVASGNEHIFEIVNMLARQYNFKENKNV